MSKLEQLASAHESVSEILHAMDAFVLIGIICVAAGIPMPAEILEVRYRNPRIEIRGLVKRAQGKIVDLVYSTLSADGKLELWLVEVELSWDLDKIKQWAAYETGFEYELHAHAARLAVFAPDPELREKIRTKILPRIKTDPVLVQPDQIERITDYEEAARRPEEAVLGCLFHAHSPAPFDACVEVFRAAWLAIQSLAERKAQRYSVAVMSIVPEAVVEQGITDLRESGDLDEERWELFSDTERKGHSFARGHREGLEEGRCQTLRRAVLDILELRGFKITNTARECVSTCESVEQLERWYAAAKSPSNQTVEQVLDQGSK